MSISLNDWLTFLENKNKFSGPRNLKTIKDVYKKICKRNIASKVISIAGTNGKGTTAECLSDLLISRDKKVGLYTSPHLFRFNERIKVNTNPISDDLIVKSFELVHEVTLDKSLSYFDFITLAALHYFSTLELDYVILEVGLGGRLDPINIIDADISILTNIDLDHTNLLGKSKKEIAIEKVAIFRKDKIAIIGQRDIDLDVKKVLNSKGAIIYQMGQDFTFFNESSMSKGVYKFYRSDRAVNVSEIINPSLSIESFCMALTACHLLDHKLINKDAEILNKIIIPYRRQLIKNRVLVDVSHNPAASKFLADFIKKEYYGKRKLHAVIGLMSDKDALGIIEPMIPLISSWYTTSPNIYRAENKEYLKELIIKIKEQDVMSIEGVDKAVKLALNNHPNEDIIVIFGSFHTVSEAHQVINNIEI
tara:strand:- start:4728 stop:5990 length:1263 start_codon:yes stop_codon:yes gene_type:complete